jgi:hypothetical protein
MASARPVVSLQHVMELLALARDNKHKEIVATVKRGVPVNAGNQVSWLVECWAPLQPEAGARWTTASDLRGRSASSAWRLRCTRLRL